MEATGAALFMGEVVGAVVLVPARMAVLPVWAWFGRRALQAAMRTNFNIVRVGLNYQFH